jgi:hypothetical protein
VEGAGQVGGEHIGPHGVREFGDRRESDDARGGDEKVDTAGPGGDGPGERGDSGGVAGVEQAGVAGAAVRFDQPRCFGQASVASG